MGKSKKLLIGLFVFLSIAVILLFYVKKNPASKLAKAIGLKGGVTAVKWTTATTAATTTSPTAPTVGSDSNTTTFPLQFGSKGKAVKIVQASLNLTVDGIWGNETNTAVKKKLGVTSIDADMFSDSFDSISDSDVSNLFPLLMGANNVYVKDVQILVGVPVDGIYGIGTAAAVNVVTGNYTLEFADYVQLVGNVLGVAVVQTTSEATSWAQYGY